MLTCCVGKPGPFGLKIQSSMFSEQNQVIIWHELPVVIYHAQGSSKFQDNLTKHNGVLRVPFFMSQKYTYHAMSIDKYAACP